MQIKIYRLIILLFLPITILDSLAQEFSYYDHDWNPVTNDSAYFYFVTIENIPIYRISTITKFSKNLEKHKKKISRRVDKEIGNKELYAIDFCDSKYDSVYIGKKVKIFAKGEYYYYLCSYSNDSIDWPSNAIKNKSGGCYQKCEKPKDGVIGTIVWKFSKFKSSTGGTVFLLKIADYYIPIDGDALTLCDKYTSGEAYDLKAKKHPKRYIRREKKVKQI